MKSFVNIQGNYKGTPMPRHFSANRLQTDTDSHPKDEWWWRAAQAKRKIIGKGGYGQSKTACNWTGKVCRDDAKIRVSKRMI